MTDPEKPSPESGTVPAAVPVDIQALIEECATTWAEYCVAFERGAFIEYGKARAALIARLIEWNKETYRAGYNKGSHEWGPPETTP